MADPGMLSLFGDDAGLFSDGLDGLGDCFPQQTAPGQSNPLAQQTNPSLNHEHQGNRGYHQGMMHSAGPGPGQPKMGQMYDHSPYPGYDQPGAPGGRMMAQNGPSQGPTNVNAAMNGMASHYHNNPANSSNPHHGYPGDAGGGGGGSGLWNQQQQGRSAYQQPSTQPGGGPNQIGYQMSQGNYGGMQGPPTPSAACMNQHYPPQNMAHPPAQDPSHYMGRVGMGGPQMRQPQPQPQGYPNMGHTPRYPHSPSRQPPHTHQHQQGMGGFGGAQYPGYQAQYGAIGPGMGQGANANVSANTSKAMGPGQLGQRFNQGSGTAAGQQGQRYPPGPAHQPQPLQTHSAQIQQQTGQQGQPMHPLNHPQHTQNLPQSQNQPQSHLAAPAQGSYPSPSSMSPMRVLGTLTPPPQQGRPPSAGLAGPPEVAGYTALQSPPSAMAHAQRTSQTSLSAPHPQHQQSHNMTPSAGQIYPSMGPQRAPQMGPSRPQLQQQQGTHEAPVSQGGDQRLLQTQQQVSRSGQPMQPAPMVFQGPPVSQHGAPGPNQGLATPAQNSQTQHTHLPPHHLQSTPPQPNPASNPWAPPPPASHPLSSPPLTPQKVPHVQHSPTDPSGDASMRLPDRPAVGAGAPGQPIGTEQPSDQETKPKKKKKKKAKIMDGDEEEGVKKSLTGATEEDVKLEFPGSGSDVGQQVTDKGIEESSPLVEEKKKRKKKPKEKTEGNEPKEQKTPKTPKTPKDPKEKKAKSSTPKTKTPKKTSSKKVESEGGASAAKKDSKRKRESSVSDCVEVKSPPSSPPEEEDDDGVQKRRSSRQVKRKRYTEDLEFRISEDDSGDDSPAPKSPSSSSQHQDVAETEGPVVEKIMGLRTSKKQLESGEEVEVEEFYVKFKGFSYLHCRWADLEELEKDKRIHQKVKRFRAKQQLNNFITEMDDEPFNPDYVEVDRVLDVSESTDENGEMVTLYLVKWCSLPYEDSTWELKADIDQSKIEEYERIAARTPNTKRVDRPHAVDWKKLDSSREYRNGNALREYQLEGLNWLTFNWYNSRNCILADEMGLGKTIQSITFLYEIYMKGIEGPFLVIAPLSTIPNWEREFRTWTELNVVVYHGSQASRKTIQAYEMYYRDTQGKILKGVYRFHAVITTFEMILADCPELRSVPWRCVVIDEAHRLKNRNCKLLEGLKMMDMEHKVLLTGTPLQNTVEELFSLLNFLEPDRFPSEQTFMTEFGDLKTEEQVQKLQGILKPMMLRRLKEDVEKNLAPKEETIIEVELTNIQKKYYRAILEKNFSFLSKGGAGGGGGGGASVPNLLNTMMELRKCCNHPYLITGAEEKIIEEFRESHSGVDMPDTALQAMIQAAGKLVLIDKLLPKLKAGGHRVLVFSQMVRCLDILEDYLIQKRYPYERIDGRVRGNLRQAAIDRFSRPDSDRFVFLLCTRAGGLGINLTAADTCIIFDSDWNPQNDLQAQARCHRIGQSKSVKIYRLITRNSYEREMFDKASLKLGLDKAVLQSMSGRENVQQLSKKEIEDLLRKGAYGALMDEEDEGSKFCEEDIDQILQRRTHTITIESEGKGSTFAKASFVAAGNRTDISLEDPDFWQKWAKKAELDLDAINGRNTLVIDTPRVRKQTRHYSSVKEDEMLEFSELESDDDEPSKPLSKPRRPQDKTQGYPRSECFRVEKNLLVYGWGRWSDILAHGRFKRPLKEADVETICRALLAYCLLHYRGDENIKSFIWDLITPSEDGTTKTLTNHSGLSTPVPRGRKGKKGKPPVPPPQTPRADWLASCNPDHLLQEDSYKRHLKHHCNKVLLRVRMLYYLRQEVIGDQATRILEGADSNELDIWIPQPFHAEVPADWWDSEADKSLLVGVFKHGYEKYNSMRADPALCFLERVGMPDAKAIAAEQRGSDMMADGDEDPEYKPLRMPFKDDLDDFTNSPLDDKDDTRLYWPAASALTARLRRLITAYQRSNRREQLRQEALNSSCLPWPWLQRQEEEELLTSKMVQWTRREEADFYRVVSTFGVVFDTQRQKFDWTQFRAFARLDKKTDESLEKYYYSFIAMCKRVCRMQVKTETELPDPTLIIDPITEERASRTLYRIELLRRIREQVLPHPLLSERLKLCQPSPDLPEWWECGHHDRDLLLGASKHGVSRTDYHILNDPTLAFLEAHQRFTSQRGANISMGAQGETGRTAESISAPILTPAELVNFPSLCTASAASEQKNFDEESVASLSTSARDETRDGFCPDDLPETSALQALQDRAYAFSFWPKDRVMINRMDNICEAVLKGKWPVTRRHIFDFPSNLLPGHGSMVPAAAVATATESPLQRRSLAELTMVVYVFAVQGMHHHHKASPSLAGFPSALVTSPSLKTQMELLQQAPPSGHRANGSLEADLPIIRRRRGRRKNVEGLDLLFMGNKRAGGKSEELLLSQFSKPKQKRHRCRNPNKIDINTLTGDERVPVVNRRNGRKVKSLQQNIFSFNCALHTEQFKCYVRALMSSGFLPEAMFDRLLTGPVVREEGARRRGRRPKSEIAKAAAAAQAAAAQAAQASLASAASSAGGINPLLLNSLFGGMDLSSLQSLQSLQLAAGLMAFPPPTDPKQAAASAAAASMLPLMLPGMGGLPNMAALPNMFSLGGLFGGNLATAAAAASNSAVAAASGNTNGTLEAEGGESDETVMKKRKREEKEEGEDGDLGQDEEVEKAEENDGGKKAKVEKEPEEGPEKVEKSVKDSAPQVTPAEQSAEASINGDAAALLAAAGMSANSLAFNPFLLSTMAPGLLYPSMFLPPGLGGLSLPGFPAASTLAELQNAMAGALGGNVSTTNPPRNEQAKKGLLTGEDEEEEEEEEEEEGGGGGGGGGGEESDLAEEKEGGAHEEMRGEADSAAEDAGIGGEEEEATASPQKDKSD
uniref:DNA helicase n=1 Tax=Anabas testudineus TaxID=64144 RepID=A0A7N6B9N4_ANATE